MEEERGRGNENDLRAEAEGEGGRDGRAGGAREVGRECPGSKHPDQGAWADVDEVVGAAVGVGERALQATVGIEDADGGAVAEGGVELGGVGIVGQGNGPHGVIQDDFTNVLAGEIVKGDALSGVGRKNEQAVFYLIVGDTGGRAGEVLQRHGAHGAAVKRGFEQRGERGMGEKQVAVAGTDREVTGAFGQIRDGEGAFGRAGGTVDHVHIVAWENPQEEVVGERVVGHPVEIVDGDQMGGNLHVRQAGSAVDDRVLGEAGEVDVGRSGRRATGEGEGAACEGRKRGEARDSWRAGTTGGNAGGAVFCRCQGGGRTRESRHENRLHQWDQHR